MKWLLYILGALIALALVVTATFYIAGQDIWRSFADPPRFDEFADVPRPSAANEFLACPPGLCRDPDLVTPVYAVSPAELRAALTDRLRRTAGVPLSLSPSDNDLRYTTYTPIMNFPDDTDIRIGPGPNGGSTIAIRARARIGEEDFGANETRVREWLSLLADLEA